MVKWTQKVLQYTKTILFWGQRPKSSSKALFKLALMMTFVVVLNTQMKEIKLRSSILISKSDAQKQVVEFEFGCRFHYLNYFEFGIFFHIFLNSLPIRGHHHKTL